MRIPRPDISPVVFAGIIVILCILAATVRMYRGTEDQPRKTSVILISIDTLRPDHLGCYGYSRKTSPAVDGLSGDGVRFQTAIAQAPSTLPSHASMLTGRIPTHHGAFHSAPATLSHAVQTLAEVLSENGFRTAAFHGGGQMSPVFGLDRGFDTYEQVRSDDFRFAVGRAIPWIRTHGESPFFLFLHTYETHVPYRADKGILDSFGHDYTGALPDTIVMDILDQYNFRGAHLGAEDLEHIICTYDAAIYNMDRSLNRFIRFLKDRGIYDRVLMVFTSDHGEEFMERNKVGYHCHTVYDELIRVPLIMKFPGTDHASRSIPEQVRSIDIMPTILDYLGISHRIGMDGASLLPLLTRGGKHRGNRETYSAFAVSERDDLNGDHHIMSIRTGDEKLYVIMKNGTIVRRYLFDLGSDPEESRNSIARGQDRAERLWRIFRKIRYSMDIPQLEYIGLDRETEAELKALGYLRDQ